MACGELAQAAQLVAGDPDAHRLLGARQAPGDPRASTSSRTARCRAASSSGQRSCRCHCSVLLSATRVADQALAVVDQQPEVELGARQLRGRQASRGPRRSAARATATASMRSDLPRSRPSAASPAISRVGTRNDALAARDQEPLQASPRRAGSPPAPTPARRRGRAPRPPAPRTRGRRPRPSCSPSSSPVAASTAATVCERLWVSAPSTIMTLVHVPSDSELDARRTRLAWGAATLLSSHAGHPRPATSDTTKGSQATPADSLKESQLAARSGPSPRRRTSPTRRITNSKPRSSGRVPTGLGRASRASRYSFASMARCGRQARGLFEWPVGR